MYLDGFQLIFKIHYFFLLYLVPVHRTLPTAKSSLTRSLAQFVASAYKGEQPYKLTGMSELVVGVLCGSVVILCFINPSEAKPVSTNCRPRPDCSASFMRQSELGQHPLLPRNSLYLTLFGGIKVSILKTDTGKGLVD